MIASLLPPIPQCRRQRRRPPRELTTKGKKESGEIEPAPPDDAWIRLMGSCDTIIWPMLDVFRREMAKLMMGCGENERIVLFCLFWFFLCTLFFCVYTVFFCVHKKKMYICLILFFLCTQILGLIISHCARKHCLWHALDSWFRTLASYFSYWTKMESCKNLFCALSFSPQKSFYSKTRDFLRTRFVASQRQLQENVFTPANLFGGAILLFPPI